MDHAAATSPKRRLARAITSVLLLVVVAGCSKRPEEYLLATGEFRFEDGTRLEGVEGLVRFSPVGQRNTRSSSSGGLESDGTFELWTYETEFEKQHKGLRQGEYNVVLLEYDQDRVVKEKYRHFEETPWTATVTADGDNHFEFTLERIDKTAT